ncbi:hypothetical protein M3J07_000017 [Ascochyta lentis]
MHFEHTTIALFSLTALSTAVVVDLFSDTDFQRLHCFRITASDQQLSAYSKNYCADKVTACTGVSATGDCQRATNDDGGSNALGPSPVFGAL